MFFELMFGEPFPGKYVMRFYHGCTEVTVQLIIARVHLEYFHWENSSEMFLDQNRSSWGYTLVKDRC